MITFQGDCDVARGSGSPGVVFLHLKSWTKLNGTPCSMAEKRLFLPPFPLFNVGVMLSRTLTYMLTCKINLGDGGRGKVALLN